ncbi:MAG: response regulator [Acidobacteria bacterium]|nr:response regulator [Acidobacteriota bacterium]MBI3488122.1 response regulator [Acidobacteriota bacterium]
MPMLRPNDQAALKILVVDDDSVTRGFTKGVLEADGFEVLLAEDGEEGLTRFLEDAPDLVLTDYKMPGMNGAELTRQIRTSIKQRFADLPLFVPIVVFTALGELEVLKECLDAGAMEFLTKPFNGPELRTRIRAIAQMASAHAGLLAREVEEHYEISVLKHVLGRQVEQSKAALPKGFAMETMSTRRINGDVCAYHVGAPGIHFGMICDPMGHGLMAGISEIPTMDVFNALSARDFPLPRLLSEINRKLRELLPGGRFSCVLLFRMDMHTGDLSVASAGMPDAYVFRRDGSLVRFPSTCIPLGIQHELGPVEVHRLRLEDGDCFFACSDGLSEIVEEDELLDLFQKGGETRFTSLLQNLMDERIRDRELADDVSWCLWPFRPERARPLRSLGPAPLARETETGITLRFTFDPRALNYGDLGSNLVSFLGRQGVPEAVSQVLALLLSEAIVNAVDHGVLDLDSALKESEFEVYEAARVAQLSMAHAQFVGVEILVNRTPDGAFSHLFVQVSDPGRGFDWQRALAETESAPEKPHGRGLILLKALGRDLAFNDIGNEVSFSLYAADV